MKLRMFRSITFAMATLPHIQAESNWKKNISYDDVMHTEYYHFGRDIPFAFRLYMPSLSTRKKSTNLMFDYLIF